jgi:hypothetical protein
MGAILPIIDRRGRKGPLAALECTIQTCHGAVDRSEGGLRGRKQSFRSWGAPVFYVVHGPLRASGAIQSSDHGWEGTLADQNPSNEREGAGAFTVWANTGRSTLGAGSVTRSRRHRFARFEPVVDVVHGPLRREAAVLAGLVAVALPAGLGDGREAGMRGAGCARPPPSARQRAR